MTRERSTGLLVGLLVGAGLGVAAALWLRHRRETVVRRVKPCPDPTEWRPRKAERVGRGLSKRLERMRTAGY